MSCRACQRTGELTEFSGGTVNISAVFTRPSGQAALSSHEVKSTGEFEGGTQVRSLGQNDWASMPSDGICPHAFMS